MVERMKGDGVKLECFRFVVIAFTFPRDVLAFSLGTFGWAAALTQPSICLLYR